MTRDLSKRQFYAALKRHAIELGFLPHFYCVSQSAKVYGPNGGATYREQLAYLIREQRAAKEMSDE